MSHPGTFSFRCVLLLALFPLCANAAPKDPCKLLQRDLDQQIDDLKAWQKLDLQECYKVSGSDSDGCRRLQDRHAQDLRSFRDERAYQMANCRGNRTRSVAAVSLSENSNNDLYEHYYASHGKCIEYPYVKRDAYDSYVHARHHHYYEQPHGAAKTAHANAGKPSKSDVEDYSEKGAKRDASEHTGSRYEHPAQSAQRGSDHHDGSSHPSQAHGNSPSAASSSHGHDSGAHSGSSHASGSGSDSHAGSSSASSSSAGASHSSSSGSGSGSSSGSSAASTASSASHDSGGSRPH